MRKIRQLFLLWLVVTVSVAWSLADDREVYGEGVTGESVTSIESILKTPEKYAGETVRIKGRIADVCRNMGCWMEIQGKGDARLTVKVEDGVIVFPTSAVGRTAIAEGEVEILDMSREKYTDWLKHKAEEQGRTFNPADVGSPPYRMVRLRGKGAVVMDSN